MIRSSAPSSWSIRRQLWIRPARSMTGAPAVTLVSFAMSVPAYAPALLLTQDPIAAMKAREMSSICTIGRHGDPSDFR